MSQQWESCGFKLHDWVYLVVPLGKSVNPPSQAVCSASDAVHFLNWCCGMILRSRGMADSSGKDSSPSEVKQRKATANASDTSLQELAEMLQGFMESQAARDERAE
ncbi:hypothetical protein SRHO_G00003160 [Serrasalmus rhombeus]